MARILGAVARKESDDKSRRIKRKVLELAQAGLVSGGGTRPYGFESDRKTIREEEAAVIRECARRLLAGESLRSLCADLNERGVPTVKGAEWKTQTLRRILGSGRISGQREHHEELVSKAEWPPIIPTAQTARIRALMNDPVRRTNRSARRYLLVRLLRCGLCGATLVSRPRDDGQRRYICAKGPNYAGCGRIYIVADDLEAFVVEAVLYRLNSPVLASALNASHRDADDSVWQEQADEAAAQLGELAEAYGSLAITLSEWLAARNPIEQRLNAAKKRLAKLSRADVLDGHVGDPSGLRERWADADTTAALSSCKSRNVLLTNTWYR
jgi:site-specific DNA recombinase